MMDDHDSVGEDDDHDDHSICKAYVKGLFLVHHFKFSTFGTNKWPESIRRYCKEAALYDKKSRISNGGRVQEEKEQEKSFSQGVKEDTIKLSDLMGREGPCFHCGIERPPFP